MKKLFECIPYKKVGDFIFGMPRKQALDLIGDPTISCMYGYPMENRFEDDFPGIHLYCNPKELLEYVEMYPGVTEDEYVFVYDDIEIILTKDIDDMIAQLNKITDDLTTDEDKETYSSKKLGLEFYCLNGVVENIMFQDAGIV